MTIQELTPGEISDRILIHDVLIRYSTGINDKNIELIDSCFTDDASCDYSAIDGPNGPYSALRQWLQKSLGHVKATLHRIGNITYEFDGDIARTRSMYMNPFLIELPGDNQGALTVGGYYDDEFVRGEEGWRICKRVDVPTYQAGKLPTREEIEEILSH